MYFPSDTGKTIADKIQFYNEIRDTIGKQILSLTSDRTVDSEYKLSPQDMQYMYRLFAHNSQLIGIEIRAQYQIWADRYMVYGDRVRKR